MLCSSVTGLVLFCTLHHVQSAPPSGAVSMSVSASASPVHRHADMLRREAGSAISHHRQMGSFESYDVDRDGYLGSKEAQTMLQDMNVDPAMWHAYAGKKDMLISRLAYERLVDDSKVFQRADKDGSDDLDHGEIQALETEAGIEEGTFNWRTFDTDKNNKLSKAEFLAAGPAAAHAAAEALGGASLLASGEDSKDKDTESKEEEDAGAEADGWAWAIGGDGPGEEIDLGMMEGDESLLEESELQDMMNGMDHEDEQGLSLLQENEEYDEDLDDPPTDEDEEGGSLLEEELSEEDQQSLDYIMNNDLDLSEQDERRVASELFQAFDSDGNGVLDESEINQVLERADLPKFNWRAYDHNKDDQLTQDEFYSMGSDGQNKENPDLMDGILAQLYEEPEDGNDQTPNNAIAENAMTDASQDGSSDENTDTSSADSTDDGSSQSDSESGSASDDTAASTTAAADLDGPTSSAEEGSTGESSEDGEKEDQKSDADVKEEEKADKEVFHQIDSNHDGKLDENELDAYLEQAHRTNFNWKAYDKDGDGALNAQEFGNAGHEYLKEPDSSQ
eukprot:gnl/MRDRNA2_/MRDRNA2_101771_c0_seq1.p1 gnl/MRDRNA2_/MRDRNA2_101771_c0~~gnl/MRDRNA2_/MRDRNA2_101771_c0_seq1.p1  ORF type:complete len:563 (-),score=183.12 gnl/MRDRNA2_/MRDRNA2_101771_c0_seq1:52-1740(-)